MEVLAALIVDFQDYAKAMDFAELVSYSPQKNIIDKLAEFCKERHSPFALAKVAISTKSTPPLSHVIPSLSRT